MAYITEEEIADLKRISNTEYRMVNSAIQFFLLKQNCPNATVKDLITLRKTGFPLKDKV